MPPGPVTPPPELAAVSTAQVDAIVQRAMDDEAYFELLRTRPEEAIAGFDLDETERSAFLIGAYNAAVRARRRTRADDAARAAAAAAEVQAQAAAAQAAPPLPPASTEPARGTGVLWPVVAALVLLLAGSSAGYRAWEGQWPWQAAGLVPTAAPASIPRPTLGARPPASHVSAPTPANAAATSAPAGLATPVPGAATPAPSSSSNSPAEVALERAYFQAISQPLLRVVTSYRAILVALRAGSDAAQPLDNLTAGLKELRQKLPQSTPPSTLQAAHRTLVEAVPLLQADTAQLKAALAQQNEVQAVLIAGEINAVLSEMQDEVTFASQPHPDFVQGVGTSQTLSNVVQFDVVGQSINQVNSGPAAVTMRIALRPANPSAQQIADTLHHGVIVARQSFPQATEVQVQAFQEQNNQVGKQLGSAGWYCGATSLPSGVPPSANWQQFCGRVYISVGANATPTAVPY
ncbi:MAG TPA: hypothetical protein VMV93_02035 [Chloroflexota bacterium]|nr:hypothetical protein [Chloroflexota bacterium]